DRYALWRKLSTGGLSWFGGGVRPSRAADVRPVWRPNDSRRRKLLPRPSGLERGQISPRLAWQQRARRKSPSAPAARRTSVRSLECQKPQIRSKARAVIRLGTTPSAKQPTAATPPPPP